MEQPAQFASYKNLIVYQKVKSLAVDIISYFSKFKLVPRKDFLINQLFRSICSIGANIAEGYGRHYKGNLKQFYGIARGSSFESDYWLEIIATEDLFDESTILNFSERNTEISKMLTTMMKNAQLKT